MSTCWLQSFYINRFTLDFGYVQYILCRRKKVGFKYFIFHFCRYNCLWFYKNQYTVCLKALFGKLHHQLEPILRTYSGGDPLCMNVPSSIKKVPFRGCWVIKGFKSLGEVLGFSDADSAVPCSRLIIPILFLGTNSIKQTDQTRNLSAKSRHLTSIFQDKVHPPSRSSH